MNPVFCVLLATTSVVPLTWSDVGSRLLAVFALIAVNAFFVAAEFSIVSVRRSRINQLASGGDVQAKTVQSLQQGIERLLSTTQLGITLSSLALGWIAQDTIATILTFGLHQGGAHQAAWHNFVSHSLSLPLAFLLIAYWQIVLGELCPKSLALMYPEQIARVIGPTSLSVARLFTPIIWVLNQSTRFLLRLLGVEYRAPSGYAKLTPEELQLMISTSTEIPDLDQEERDILNNVFEFRDVMVQDIMVPRTRMTGVSVEATFQDLLDTIAEVGYSKYPVMGESFDDIVGIIAFQDLAVPLSKNQLRSHTPIRPWMRPAKFVPDSLTLHEVLGQMQQANAPLMIVVDAFGGTAGMVTLQDLSAEIMGEMNTPPGPIEGRIVSLDDRTVLVPAQTNMESVNEQLGIELPTSDDYQTLAGFIILCLQKIPVGGEQLIYPDAQGRVLELTVTAVDGPRVAEIKVVSPEPFSLADAVERSIAHRISDRPLADRALEPPKLDKATAQKLTQLDS
jgi:CBS domain containing-hemolysin-like protein